MDIATLEGENSSSPVDRKTATEDAVSDSTEGAADLDASGRTSVMSSSTSGGKCGSSTHPSVLDSSDDSSGLEDDMVQKVRSNKYFVLHAGCTL